MITEVPWARRPRINSRTVAASAGPSDADGSSITMIFEADSKATARAMATIWR